jgi:hypothetical protein
MGTELPTGVDLAGADDPESETDRTLTPEGERPAMTETTDQDVGTERGQPVTDQPSRDYRRRAVVTKALRDRHPGGHLHEHVADARAILDALDEFEPTAVLHEMPATALTRDEEIRARAVQSAATAFGPTFAVYARVAFADKDADRLPGYLISAWLAAAFHATRLIKTGAIDEPDDEAAGSTDGVEP